MNDHRDPKPPAEDDVARLLRLLPPPADVSGEIRDRAWAAASAEWQGVVARRARRSRWRWAAAAALAAGVLLAVGLRLGPADAPPVPETATPAGGPVAVVEALRGDVAGLRSAAGSTLVAGEAVLPGATVHTGPRTRVALRLASGASLRLDSATRVELQGPGVLRLAHGGVYVDSDDPGGVSSLTVHTPLGVVRDLGTQFELRLTGEALRVRVREGLVEVEGGATTHQAHPGTELTVDAVGIARHRTVAVHGPAWRWPLDAAPTFELEGRTLATYLAWLERETGWRVRLAEPSLESAAATTVLHGNLEGLAPDATPELVLPTCGLRHRLEDGILTLETCRSPSCA